MKDSVKIYNLFKKRYAASTEPPTWADERYKYIPCNNNYDLTSI